MVDRTKEEQLEFEYILEQIDTHRPRNPSHIHEDNAVIVENEQLKQEIKLYENYITRSYKQILLLEKNLNNLYDKE
jgi:hypothetical protein